MAAGVPFSWVAAGTVQGVSDLEVALRRAGKCSVLVIMTDHRFNPWVSKPPATGAAEAIAGGLALSA